MNRTLPLLISIIATMSVVIGIPSAHAWTLPSVGRPLPVVKRLHRAGPNGTGVQQPHMKEAAVTFALVGLLWLNPLVTQPASADTGIVPKEFLILVEKIEALDVGQKALNEKIEALDEKMDEQSKNMKELRENIDSKSVQFVVLPLLGTVVSVFSSEYKVSTVDRAYRKAAEDSVNKISKNINDKQKAEFYMGAAALLLISFVIVTRAQGTVVAGP